MTTTFQKIFGWAPAILLALFMIVASGGAKFFIQDGTEAAEFTKALGAWDIRYYIGALEILGAVLLLIPRTATLGFFVLVGVLGGAMATSLTHDVEGNWPWFPLALIGVMMISAYFRTPELLARVKDPSSVPNPGKKGRIVSWILVALVALMTIASAIAEFIPVTNPETIAFIERLGIHGMEKQLGLTKLILALIFLYPRTSAIGLVLMVGYYAGAVATNLTHNFTFPEYAPLVIVLVLLAIIGWIRNPELKQRLLGRPVSA
jgi:hypothetical protein